MNTGFPAPQVPVEENSAIRPASGPSAPRFITTRPPPDAEGPQVRQSTPPAPDSGYGSNSSSSVSAARVPSALRIFDREPPAELSARFLDIKVLYNKPLLDAISKKGHREDVSMKLKYMGCSEESAVPHIVIQAGKRAIRKARQFFNQQHVKQEIYPHFQVWFVDTAPIRLESEVLVYGAFSALETLCGLQISMASAETTSFATIGGLILASSSKGQPFGLTAAHPVKSVLRENFPGISDLSDSDTDEMDDDSSVEEPIIEDYDIHRSNHLRLDETGIGNSVDGLSPATKTIGKVTHHSLNVKHERPGNLDWALIELSTSAVLPNIFCRRADPQPQTTHDDTTSMNDEPGRRPSTLFCSSMTTEIWEQDVVLQTARESIEGRLRVGHSGLLLSPGKVLVETLDFLPNSGSTLKHGDSGSWVIEPSTGEVFGHVVSVDIFGEATVIPIQSTLADIKEELSCDQISLPTAHELEVFLSERLTRPGKISGLGHDAARTEGFLTTKDLQTRHDIMAVPSSSASDNPSRENLSEVQQQLGKETPFQQHQSVQEAVALSPRHGSRGEEVDVDHDDEFRALSQLTGANEDMMPPEIDTGTEDLPRRRRRLVSSPTVNDDPEDGENDDLGPLFMLPTKLKPKKMVLAGAEQSFACPFFKKSPAQFFGCCKYALIRVRDVRQHLRRRHGPLIHCARCGAVFPDEKALQHHVLNVACTRRPFQSPGHLTLDQMRKISVRPKGYLSPEQAWGALFHVVFPDLPVPSSPYSDPTLASNVAGLWTYQEIHGPRILADTLATECARPDGTGLITREIIQRGLQQVFNSWADRDFRDPQEAEHGPVVLRSPEASDNTSHWADLLQAKQGQSSAASDSGYGSTIASSERMGDVSSVYDYNDLWQGDNSSRVGHGDGAAHPATSSRILIGLPATPKDEPTTEDAASMTHEVAETMGEGSLRAESDLPRTIYPDL